MKNHSVDKDYKRAILSKAVWMYYIEGMTQKDIAKSLGTTRLKVIKMLEEARNKNLIQFHIPVLDREKIELEQKITKHFHLNDVFIVSSNPEDNINESIAQAAAMYINDSIKENTFINMGYGDTLGRVLNNLANISEKRLSIISMTGGVAPYLPNDSSHIFNAQLFLLPTPLLMSSAETAQNILLEQPVKEIFEMSSLATISVVGIGGMNEESTIMKSDILSKNEFLQLKMRGAVGDILMHFINDKGELIESEIEDKLVSTNLSKLKEMDNVIAVAAGIEKIDAIRAGLIGGYIDTLITDETTAKYLIKEDG